MGRSSITQRIENAPASVIAPSFGCEATQSLVVGARGRKLNKIKRLV